MVNKPKQRSTRLLEPGERVLLRTRVSPSGCLEFQGAINGGYGVLGVGTRSAGDRRTVRAHRVIWESANGPVPSGLLVCHRCDNRRCVNLGHLFLGTHKDNTADMISKGRKNQPCVAGVRNPRARLNEDRVREIKQELAQGVGPTELRVRYGMSHGAITSIKSGKNWGWV